MARPKEFDVGEALDRALEVFWRKGYDATSVADLVAAMGIQRASIYGTFGDKRSLYLRALTSYQDRALLQLEQRLAGPGPALAALRALVLGIADRAGGGQGSRGCFNVNANVELAPHDPAVRAQVRRHSQQVEDLLARTLERARKAQDLPKSADCRRLAAFLFATIVALNVLGKQRGRRERLRAVARQALAALRA